MSDPLSVSPDWQPTAHRWFIAAARVEGVWWVLRLNQFPDHPLWTLFVDGRVRGDLETAPAAWILPPVGDPELTAGEDEEALGPLRSFLAYGSEAGRPCDNMFCCGFLTEEDGYR